MSLRLLSPLTPVTKLRSPQQHLHFWQQLYKFRVPKITLRFNNLLEGFTELTELLYSWSQFIAAKGYRLVSQVKRCLEPHLGVFYTWSFQLSSASEIVDRPDIFQQQCMTVHMVCCQPVKLTWALVFSFYWGIQSHRYGWPPMCLTFSL